MWEKKETRGDGSKEEEWEQRWRRTSLLQMLAAVCVAARATEQQSKRMRRAPTRLSAEFNHTLTSPYFIKAVRLGKKKQLGRMQKFTTVNLECVIKKDGGSRYINNNQKRVNKRHKHSHSSAQTQTHTHTHVLCKCQIKRPSVGDNSGQMKTIGSQSSCVCTQAATTRSSGSSRRCSAATWCSDQMWSWCYFF